MLARRPQCTVGNLNRAPIPIGITGNDWLLLLLLLLLRALRRMPVGLVLASLYQAFGQIGELFVTNPSGFERHCSLCHVVEARAVCAVCSADDLN